MEERFQDDRHRIKIRLPLMTENTACGFSLLHWIRAGLDQSHALRTYRGHAGDATLGRDRHLDRLFPHPSYESAQTAGPHPARPF